jgi:predicted PurR-regulated permease PerM
MLEQKITFDSFVRGALTVAGIVGVLALLNFLSPVLLPFFVAWLLAYMIYPLVKFLQYKIHLRNRVLCIFLALALIVGVFWGIVMLVVPSAVEEYEKLRTLVSDYVVNGARNSTIPATVEQLIQENLDETSILQFLNEDSVFEAIKQLVPQVWKIIYETVNFIIGILMSAIILLYMFFILMDYEKIMRGWVKLVPVRFRRTFYGIGRDVQSGMQAYFRGQALVATCVGILFSLGFLLIDFPMAIALGLFIGLLNMVPYLQTIGLLPTVILALLKASDTGENFWMVLVSALLVFVVVQIIQDMILVPKIMGRVMGLNPAVILLSLSVWGYLLGMIGLILALPLTTIILSYYHRFILHDESETARRARKERYKQEIDEILTEEDA